MPAQDLLDMDSGTLRDLVWGGEGRPNRAGGSYMVGQHLLIDACLVRKDEARKIRRVSGGRES